MSFRSRCGAAGREAISRSIPVLVPGGGSADPPRREMLPGVNVPDMTALQLAAAIRAGDLSAREAVDACLDAVDRTNGELNAVIWRDDDAARGTADSLDASALPFGG